SPGGSRPVFDITEVVDHADDAEHSPAQPSSFRQRAILRFRLSIGVLADERPEKQEGDAGREESPAERADPLHVDSTAVVEITARAYSRLASRFLMRRLTPPAACRKLICQGVRLPVVSVRPFRIPSRTPATVWSVASTCVTAWPTISAMWASLPAVIGRSCERANRPARRFERPVSSREL